MRYLRLIILLLILATALLLQGCSARITPPDTLKQPVTVYLLDHGRHASLLLPDQDHWRRYSYGDWRYYALGEKTTQTAIAALLWSTPGALGRQQITSTEPPITPAALGVGIEHVYPLKVEHTAVQALLTRLDKKFFSHTEHLYINPTTGMAFVRIDTRYRFDRNSNVRVAQWLKDLGCEVTGWPQLSRWSQ